MNQAPLTFDSRIVASTPRVAVAKRLGRIVVGLLLACGLFLLGWYAREQWQAQQSREALPAASDVGTTDRDAVAVTVEPVLRTSVQRTIEAVGTLHGFEEMAVSAKVDGRVVSVRHDVADRVAPGELLIEVDWTDFELAERQAARALEVELTKLGLDAPPSAAIDLNTIPSVEQATARLELALAREQRIRQLAQSRAATVEDVERAISELRVAQAELEHQKLQARSGLAAIKLRQAALDMAAQQKQDTRVFVPRPVLPVPGTVQIVYAITRRGVSEGSMVRMGTELFRLVIDDVLKLRVQVPERHANDVRVGQQADVSTAASTESAIGEVTKVNPAIDPATRTLEVELRILNQSHHLRPGGFAKAAIATRVDDGSVTVPSTAIVNFAGVTKIFLVEGDHVREAHVTLGIQQADRVEVLSPDLPESALVVTSGQTVLADGSRVRIRSSDSREGMDSPTSTSGGAPTDSRDAVDLLSGEAR